MSESDPQHVTIWDVYQAVQALDKRLAVNDETMKAIVSGRADHEIRIRTLEKWAYAIPLTIVGTVVAGLLAVIIK